MSLPAISVERLSKRYRLRQGPAEGLSARLHPRRVAAWLRGRPASGRPSHQEFEALRDVSFEVTPGEIVGVIGRNGAGKSTLLKILSRVTEPSSGQACVRGRVGSLLEVGAGFHPELSGRDNIYLNGAILGMSRAEIRNRFDPIVAFAEIERFLDTPVKRYSSGMYVRLAFAVAAHLDPEILLVDEALAVGDTQFQRRCLGRMGEVSRSGRTVLFVSHSLAAVEGLCGRGILLEHGRVSFDGRAADAIARYMVSIQAGAGKSIAERFDRSGSGAVRFTGARWLDGDGANVSACATGRAAVLELEFVNRARRPLRNMHVAIGVDNQLGQRVAHLSTEATGARFEHVPTGGGIVRLEAPRLPLLPGRYFYTVYCEINGVLSDWVQNVGVLDVEGGDFYATGKLPPDGAFCMDCHFRLDASVAC